MVENYKLSHKHSIVLGKKNWIRKFFVIENMDTGNTEEGKL
jgi:hypothetical protein